MTFKLSGLLTLFLLWDFATAPAGSSALGRGYDVLAESGLVQEMVAQVRSDEFWEKVRAAGHAAIDAAKQHEAAVVSPEGEAVHLAGLTLRETPADLSGGSGGPSPGAFGADNRRPAEAAAPAGILETVPGETPQTPASLVAALPVAPVEAPGAPPDTPSDTPEVRDALDDMDLGDDILLAIVEAAEATGAHGGYLLHIALRESGLNDSAKAPTSSAAGPFQFIRQTWLQVLKSHGPKHGLDDLAGKISRSSQGQYEVADAAALREILALRHDPRVAALLAAEFTVANEAALSRALGREVTQGELYVAHVLGAGGAATLIKTVKDEPAALASVRLPAAAKANRWLFYKNGWQPRTVASLYEELTRFMSTHEIAHICNADLNFVRHL